MLTLTFLKMSSILSPAGPTRTPQTNAKIALPVRMRSVGYKVLRLMRSNQRWIQHKRKSKLTNAVLEYSYSKHMGKGEKLSLNIKHIGTEATNYRHCTPDTRSLDQEFGVEIDCLLFMSWSLNYRNTIPHTWVSKLEILIWYKSWFSFWCCDKHHDQRRLGEGRVYFSSQL